MTAPLTRLFVAVVLINGAYDAVRVAVSYRVLALGGDAAQVGLVAATFAALPMRVALQFGRLVDRRGSWGVLAVGTAVSASAVALTAVAPSLPVLAAANAMVGLGQVMTLIAAQGFVMELTTRDRHVNGFAMFTLAVSVGQAVGTPVMGVLLQAGRTGEHVETGPALWVMATAIVISLPFALTLPRFTPTASTTERPQSAVTGNPCCGALMIIMPPHKVRVPTCPRQSTAQILHICHRTAALCGRPF